MRTACTIILVAMLCGCGHRKEDENRIADLEGTVRLMAVWEHETTGVVKVQQKSIDALFECIKAQQVFNEACRVEIGLLSSNAVQELKSRQYLTTKGNLIK